MNGISYNTNKSYKKTNLNYSCTPKMSLINNSTPNNRLNINSSYNSTSKHTLKIDLSPNSISPDNNKNSLTNIKNHSKSNESKSPTKVNNSQLFKSKNNLSSNSKNNTHINKNSYFEMDINKFNSNRGEHKSITPKYNLNFPSNKIIELNSTDIDNSKNNSLTPNNYTSNLPITYNNSPIYSLNKSLNSFVKTSSNIFNHSGSNSRNKSNSTYINVKNHNNITTNSNAYKILNTKYKNYAEAKYGIRSNGCVTGYGANTNQGIFRNYNEDRVSIILNVIKPNSRKDEEWPKVSYFAIYDGHGGNKCADFLKENLHQYVIDIYFI